MIGGMIMGVLLMVSQIFMILLTLLTIISVILITIGYCILYVFKIIKYLIKK